VAAEYEAGGALHRRISQTHDRHATDEPGRNGGIGKIGVTSGFAQHIELMVDAARAAVEPRIVQRPVAVNESVGEPTGRAIRGGQTVAVGKGFAGLDWSGTELLPSIIIW
jgi:hypothetical protein